MHVGNQDPIRLEFTPNPSTLKYVLAKQLLPRGTANFTDKAEAETSPLPQRLFEVPGVTAVMVGPTFVTVTMADDADAAALNDAVHMALHAHLDAGEHPVDPAVLERKAAGSGDEDPVVRRIREIIEEEVRPAVAMDGGDITFERFQDGIVYVYMMGSCSACPSSTATLKMGIESRLKEEIPEVLEVVQI